MGKLVFLSAGAMILGSLIVVACVSDAVAPTPGAQGELDGPCFANGTCQPGLSCGVVKGNAQCVSAGSDAGAGDSSVMSDDGGTTADAVADSGPPVCTFNTTIYPCKPPAQNGNIACYGDPAVQCTASGCGATDVRWECFSPRQCSTLIPCCLPLASAALSVGATCAEGSLQFVDGGTTGGACAATSAPCGVTEMQLCQGRPDCPSGQRCNQVKVHGGGPALDKQVDIGVCVPE